MNALNTPASPIKFYLALFMMMSFGAGYAAIDIVVDVTGGDGKASTLSKKIFIERVELSFPNKRPSQSVAQFSKGFYARANFKYLGNGPLTIRWLVDGQIISQSTEILSFGKSVSVRSDKGHVSLPTFTRGTHKVDVQFINSSGVINVATKSIKYFVADGVAEFKEDGILKTLYPQNRSVDPFNFYFRWQGFKVFSAYQLEVESIADKSKKSKSIIKALSKIDVYSPTDAQRFELTKGQYRWRVKGLYKEKGTKPLVSQWASFEVIDQAEKGGVFISDIKASGRSDVSNSFQSVSSKIIDGKALNQSQQLVAQGVIKGGKTHLLNISIQNSGLNNKQNAFIDVKKGNQLLGRYPFELAAGSTKNITVPIELAASSMLRHEGIAIVISDGHSDIDVAAINLTVEPDVSIEALNFDERKKLAFDNNSLTFCFGEAADPSLLFSRIIGAASEGATQSLNQRAFFNFDEGQTVNFAAYVQDRGLGAWIDERCPDVDTTFNGNTFTVKTPRILNFLAYPVNQNGEVIGSAIPIGQMGFSNGMDGIVNSPDWLIPESGQYKITLHDHSDPVDLYATLEGGLPKYIQASGFNFEVSQVAETSTLVSSSPRQAIMSGVVTTTWKGDANNMLMQLNLNDVIVNMSASPLIGVYVSGQMQTSTTYDLTLLGQSFNIKKLDIGMQGALADFDYRLPANFQRSQGLVLNKPLLESIGIQEFFNPNVVASNTPSSSSRSSSPSSKAGSIGQVINTNPTANLLAQLSVEQEAQLIAFDHVNVFNGGEFIARYPFEQSWPYVHLQGSDLALRLNGAQLVVDHSSHVNYSDISGESGFTGIGILQSTVRVRVNEANNLFTVNNAENAFIYGQANWLEVSEQGLSGDDIEVKPVSAIADFFNQTAAQKLELAEPMGFDISINAGTFGLQNSQVGGIDLSGMVYVPKRDASALNLAQALEFEHLIKNREQFIADVTTSSSAFKLGVFNYMPSNISLRIGPVNGLPRQVNKNPTAPSFRLGSRGIDQWNQVVSQDLSFQAGLLLSGGTLLKGWDIISEASSSEKSEGTFLVTSQGLQGQWLDGRSNRLYRVNGFKTRIDGAWMHFKDSALENSKVEGALVIPYPIAKSFNFTGSMDQQAGLLIGENDLELPTSVGENSAWGFEFWKVRLSFDEQSDINRHLIFDAQNQAIKIEGFDLDLQVSDQYGGKEFVTENGKPAFTISTLIHPDGQLSDTETHLKDDPIRFLGQDFEFESIKFEPYLGNNEPPKNDQLATALPLVTLKGKVAFSVFGFQDVTIQHTAVGAQVPEISPDFQQANGDGYYGDNGGAIKVHVDLKFVNTYGRDKDSINSQVGNVPQGDESTAVVADFQEFKAFVGEAEMVLIDAFSMKGLAEAGLHQQQTFPTDETGTWEETGTEVAYEKIGLGAGVDVVKAAIAGLRGMDTVTRLGGGAIATVTGVEGLGETAIELGTEAVAFIQSVAIAVGSAVTGAVMPSEIIHAIDGGLATTNKGIELLRAICVDDASNLQCDANALLMLDLSSIMLRSAGVVTHIEDIDPQEIASIALQTIDTAIPLLKGINIDAIASVANVNVGTTLNDKYVVALSLAHTPAVALRSIVDNNGKIPFSDFLRVSSLFVDSIDNFIKLPEVQAASATAGTVQLTDLAVAVARQSIIMAESIKNDPSPQKLAQLTEQLVDALCQQSEILTPLIGADNQAQVKPLMGVTSLVLKQLSEQGIPANSSALIVSFLRSILDSLASSQGVSSACGGQGVELPVQAQSLLSMASHSLKPLDGSLNSEDKQIVWVLEGVQQALDMVKTTAASIGGNIDVNSINAMDGVLTRLIVSFGQLNVGLSDDSSIAEGQRILRIANAIPTALTDILNDAGASQANEVIKVYVVLLEGLEVLLNKAPQIAANEFNPVELFDLPLALIEQTQQISFIGANEKHSLDIISNILNMSQEVTQEKPDLTKVVQNVKQIRANLVGLSGGESGFQRASTNSHFKKEGLTRVDDNPVTQLLNRVEIDQVLNVLQFLASMANNQQNLQTELMALMPKLAPLLAGELNIPVIQSSNVVNAFVTALPIVDFTKDDLSPTLDRVLIRLLNEAEAEANGDDKNKIARARNILLMADLNVVGLTVTYEKQNGLEVNKNHPISIKHVLNDGSSRELIFSYEPSKPSLLKEFYPANHTEFKPEGADLSKGSLSETAQFNSLGDNFDFTVVADASKINLFDAYWNVVMANRTLLQRSYSDAQSHAIVVKKTDTGYSAHMTSAVSYFSFTPSRELSLETLPSGYATANGLDDVGVIKQASVYRAYGAENPGCSFIEGCYYQVGGDLTQLLVGSVVNANFKALYQFQSSNTYSNQQAIAVVSAAQLNRYYGPIPSTQAGWDSTWIARYEQGQVTLQQGDSVETIAIAQTLSSADELVQASTAATTFTQRRAVNGQVIWDYNSQTKNALFSDGIGNWQLYKMPDDFDSGSLVIPQPAGVIDVLNNAFILQAKSVNGVLTDNVGLTGNNQDGWEIAAGNVGDSISISPQGDLLIGGISISVTSGQAIVSAATDDNGQTTLKLGDGSQSQIITTHQGNIEVTKNTKAVTNSSGKTNHIETFKVRYCRNPLNPVSQCGGRISTQRFSYNATPNYFSLSDERPPITPPEGINQTIKHQLWVEFFRREAELFATPNFEALQQLKDFMGSAINAGLDETEMLQQFGYVLLKTTNLISEQLFNEYEQKSLDIDQIMRWHNNPETSPIIKINTLSDQLIDYAAFIGESLNPFFKDYFARSESLLYSSLVAVQQSLPIVDATSGLYVDNQNLPTIETLKESLTAYAQLLIHLETRKQLSGFESQTALADLCQVMQPQVSAISAALNNARGNSNASQVDAMFAIDLEANIAQIGCLSDMSLEELISSVSGSVALISTDMNSNDKFIRYTNILMAALSGKPINAHATSTQLKDYFRSVFISQFHQPNSNSALSPASQADIDLRLRVLDYLSQLKGRINSNLLSTPDNFSSSSFNSFKNQLNIAYDDLQQTLLLSLRQGFKNDWHSQIAKLNDALEQVDAVRALIELYEQGDILNQKLIGAGFEAAIVFDNAAYLKLTVMGEAFDVSFLLSAQQQFWLDDFVQINKTQSEINQLLFQLASLEDSIKLINASKGSKSIILDSMQVPLNERLEPYFLDVATQIAAFDITTETAITAIITWADTLRLMLEHADLTLSSQLVTERVQNMEAQAVARVSSAPNKLTTESLKISLLKEHYMNVIANGIDVSGWSQSHIDAVEAARQSATQDMQNNPTKQTIQKVINFEALAQSIGLGDSSSLAEVGVAIVVLVEQAEEHNNVQQKMSSLKELINIIGEAQQIGVVDLSLPNTTVPEGYIDSVSSCISNQNCTLQHLKLYYEYAAISHYMGSEDILIITPEEMADSSPETWASSMQHSYELPKLISLVPLLEGRMAAANTFEAIVNTLNFAYQADRTVLRNVVQHLRTLAAIPLANGNSLSADPLAQMAADLDRRLYQWQLEAQQQLAELLNNPNHADRPACMRNNQALDRSCMEQLARALDISNSEIADTILPALHYAAPLVPVAGNKYQAAAAVLNEMTVKDIWSDLSQQLMTQLPDPNVSSEGDYRLAAIAELASFMAVELAEVASQIQAKGITDEQRLTAFNQFLLQNPEWITGGLHKVSARSVLDEYRFILAANTQTLNLAVEFERIQSIVKALLSLPADDAPINTLSNLLKDEMLSPLLGDISCVGASSAVCLLSTSLNLVSLSLDSVIANEAKTPYAILTTMTDALAALSTSDDPNEFWIGMAAEGLKLSLNVVQQGNVNSLLTSGVDLSIRFMSSPLVTEPIPLEIRPATDFISNGLLAINQQLVDSTQTHLPIVVASISADLVFDFLKQEAPPQALGLITLGETVSSWNLNFADNNWDLLMAALDNPNNIEIEPFITAMNGVGGLAQLSCDINGLETGLIDMPPSLALTPFVAIAEILKSYQGQSIAEEDLALVLIDVAAGLSNIWITPLNCDGLAEDDLQLAVLIRQIKEIDISKGGELAALSTVGNLGLGGIKILLENDPVIDVLDLAWNGQGDVDAPSDDDAPGIADALNLAMNVEGGAADAAKMLEFTAKVPKTMGAIMDELAGAQSPAATALRLVTGNLIQDDLLTPDILFDKGGNADFANHIKYAIPNGLLGMLGIVRKGMTPNPNLPNSDDYYKNDADYGYLKTLALLSVSFDSNGNSVIEAADTVTVSTSLNNLASQDFVEQSRSLFLAGADYARLGITALKPLFDAQDSDARQAVDGINQRAIFSDLAGSGAGFSGVSGGLQREWSLSNWDDEGEINVQMYARLHIPIVLEEAVGLLELKTNSDVTTLKFDTASVSVDGQSQMQAVLSLDVQGELEMGYQGLLDVDFLGKPVGSINGSGFVNNFNAPHPDDLGDPAGYALELAKNISVGQCISGRVSAVQSPLSLIIPLNAEAEIGMFVEKIAEESLLIGSRNGIGATLYAPFGIPIGITLAGSLTTAIKLQPFSLSEFPPNELAYDSCLTGGTFFNFFSKNIPLAGVDADIKAVVKTTGELGFKFKIKPQTGLHGLLQCGPINDPIKQVFCDVANDYNTLWGAVRINGIDAEGKLSAKVTFGISNGYPDPETKVIHYSFDTNGLLPPLPSIVPSVIASQDAGWPNTGKTVPNLCAATLCSGGSTNIGQQ